ncbi:YciI family protein [Salinispora oceanensis]|uniref:YciI family protein n=1 Tax=Salinispora oceanensis TaxID=1050199 RepID=UPI0003701964|nr:YciI family protein [Salinispora oceanensis]
MAQYGIFVYAPAPADPMDLPAEYEKALETYPDQVAELGATPVTGFAFQPSTTATSVRGDVVSDSTFHGGKEVLSGFFVIEAPNLDVALKVGKLNPATQHGGGVEIRPLFVPPED